MRIWAILAVLGFSTLAFAATPEEEFRARQEAASRAAIDRIEAENRRVQTVRDSLAHEDRTRVEARATNFLTQVLGYGAPGAAAIMGNLVFNRFFIRYANGACLQNTLRGFYRVANGGVCEVNVRSETNDGRCVKNRLAEKAEVVCLDQNGVPQFQRTQQY